MKFQPIQYDSDDDSGRYFEKYFYKESDGQSFVTSSNLTSGVRLTQSPVLKFDNEASKVKKSNANLSLAVKR